MCGSILKIIDKRTKKTSWKTIKADNQNCFINKVKTNTNAKDNFKSAPPNIKTLRKLDKLSWLEGNEIIFSRIDVGVLSNPRIFSDLKNSVLILEVSAVKKYCAATSFTESSMTKE